MKYRINGRTTVTALDRELKIRRGERFAGLQALEKYVDEKRRELSNMRTLDVSASEIVYTLGAEEKAGENPPEIPVYIELVVTDTRNLLILPEPKYDSNSGFTLSLKARDYNFLGTLSPLKLDLIWGGDEEGESMAGFLVNSDIPFRALGLDWNFDFDHDFRYYFDAPVYYKNVTGLSVDLPVRSTVFTFGFEQGLVIHEKDRDAKNDGGYHSGYAYSKLYADWEIPTGIEAGNFGPLRYTPGIYGNLNYRPGGDLGDYRRGPNAGFMHNLGFGRIDWRENFRQGLKAQVFNGNDYNFFHRRWKNTAGFLAEGHLVLSRFFGLSGRLLYTRWIKDSHDMAGDVIRGYKDNQLDATQRLSLNMDFPVRLIRFLPSRRNEKTGFLDFEMHLSAFVDLLLADAEGKDRNAPDYSFIPEDLLAAAGLEIIVFPLKWRSVFLRASAGWNIREWLRTGSPPGGIHREFFVGMGHLY